jgi:hypothetical protein
LTSPIGTNAGGRGGPIISSSSSLSAFEIDGLLSFIFSDSESEESLESLLELLFESSPVLPCFDDSSVPWFSILA